jgi:hypothetical protein
MYMYPEQGFMFRGWEWRGGGSRTFSFDLEAVSCSFGSFSIGIMVCRCFGLTGKQGRFDSGTLGSAFNSDPLVEGFLATVRCARATALRPRHGDQVLRGQLLAVASRALFLTGAPAPGVKSIFSQRFKRVGRHSEQAI